MTVSKKVGGQDRADKARKELTKIFTDKNNPLYLEKDIKLASKFNISRLTLYSIRKELGIPPRTERIISRLKEIDTNQYTKKELATLLGLKYQNLYKIITECNIIVKRDIPPIISMINYQKAKKRKN
jgi:hypothetical protein